MDGWWDTRVSRPNDEVTLHLDGGKYSQTTRLLPVASVCVRLNPQPRGDGPAPAPKPPFARTRARPHVAGLRCVTRSPDPPDPTASAAS
jgi:hypothetical protein